MVSIRENYCYKPWLLDFTLDALAEMDPYVLTIITKQIAISRLGSLYW